ncbi:MAG: pyridoxamine 5'-phosphate oxidase family protein [Rickettsiales bacterium]|jgi:uncharacterized pyridoxamine 5'-phosphate oxidase family protein|nr:pyridoxamine 5'-phosphate oxidase family protein [Rickettsiales bacterium]
MKNKISLIAILLFVIVFGTLVYIRFSYTAGSETRNDIIVKFLKDSQVFYIATIDGEQPRVRPFAAVEIIDREINICTGAFKNVYRQIQENPNIEIVSLNKNGEWIRITAALEDNSNDENREIFFKTNPALRKVYENKEDFKILKLKDVRAVLNANGKEEQKL